ncbi:PAS domain-containing protein [Chitinophaga sp. 30R24]|uniref:PAS domain-containing protein n=1 Tax=Chitinophaga sp. 30R24 TaxID=3248838 RepID=UPI003B91FC6B
MEYANNVGLQFLDGGGEMGMLTRNYPWKTSSLGHPKTWPQSLRTTLSIILNSRFPMFLWWGPELICFYNDAYRPSFGINGKHPHALGQPAVEIWGEIWPVIGPQIQQVMSGMGATWDEDRLIPIIRNGRLEDVYWTYSYSPVKDECGQIGGVLVTCTETTEKVQQMIALKDTKDQLQFAIDAAGLGTWDLNPATNTFRGNSRLCEWFGLPGEAELPLSLALSKIVEEDRLLVAQAIQRALDPVKGGDYDIIYSIGQGAQPPRVVRALGRAFFNEEGQPVRFNGTLHDITREVIAQRAIEESERNFRTLVLQAPIAMCILKGPNFKVEIANNHMIDLWGKTYEGVINKPLLEGLPEIRDQGFEALLQQVLATGEHYLANERMVYLPRQGVMQPFYINFVYEPLRGAEGTITGIIVVAYDVTHFTLQRLVIGDAEERSRLAMEVTELGSYDVNLLTNYMITSPRMNVIFGLGANATHDDYINAVYWEDLPVRDAAYNDALKTGSLFYEIRIIHPDKSIHWVRVRGRVYFEDRQPVRLLGAVLDITDQKKSVNALEESNKRFKLLADAMPQLVWIADPLGKVVYYNSRIQEYKLSAAHKACGGYQWESIVHPEDLEATTGLWEDAVAGLANYSKEHRMLMKDGEYRWHLSRAIPERNINGDIMQWYGTATEIDAIKQAQEAITESEALFRQLTEEAPMFVWISDTEARLQYANRELLKYIDMEIQQLLLSNIWEKVAFPDDIPAVYTMYEQQRKDPSPFTVECRIREGKTGKYNWFLFKGVPKIEKQVFQGFIVTAVNIQGFRDAEQTMVEFSQQLERQVEARTHELATANNQLRQTNQELEQFAYIASHDLQEPLRKVRTFAGMIQHTDPVSQKLIEKIEISAARMSSLIQDLLHFSRLSVVKDGFECIELEKILENVCTDFELLIAEKNAVITRSPLPALEMIPFQANQLLANLIGNSLKFSQDGVPPQISITAEEVAPWEIPAHPGLTVGKRYCIITFRDNGIGFKQEHAEKIFKIFQRLHSKDDYSGTGIGLALCKKIVLNHHGCIFALAAPGEGAAFKVILPYVQNKK